MQLTTIEKLFMDTIKDPETWNYYEYDKIKLNNINDSEDCCNFIKNFLERGAKGIDIVNEGLNNLKTPEKNKRIKHMVSAFLLGIRLYNKTSYIKDLLDEQIRKIIPEYQTVDKEFIYFWFMLCFFHDLGYEYEEKNSDENSDESTKNKEQKVKEEAEKFIEKIGQSCFIPIHLYTSETCQAYYKYRKYKDHGLSIGGYLFEELEQNRQKFKNEGRKDLDFSDRVKELFFQIASIVTVHNIWFCTKEKQIEKYKRNNLNNLILEMGMNGRPCEYPISSSEYPLLFFFCLIDTIEPIKRTNLLSKIKISTHGSKICIESNDKDYLENIYSMNEWLCPVEQVEGKIIIEMKNQKSYIKGKCIYLFNRNQGCYIAAYWDESCDKTGLVKVNEDGTSEILLRKDMEQRDKISSLIGIGDSYAPGFEKVDYNFLASVPTVKEKMDKLAKILNVTFE